MSDIDLPRPPAHSDLTYNSYLRVQELLSLQHPESDPPHHDEMLFIIIHQAYELWFKLILHEMAQAQNAMAVASVLRARHFVDRSVVILRLLVQQIHILETMRPVDFLQFRDRLNPASGFQSVQFRTLEFALGLKEPAYLRFFDEHTNDRQLLEAALKAPDVRTTYHNMLRRIGFKLPEDLSYEAIEDAEVRAAAIEALRPIYQDPEADHALYLLTESLVDIDLQLGLWREHHVRVVQRVIGFKRGTGGSSGVGYLRTTTSKQAFPLLWDVRSALVKD